MGAPSNVTPIRPDVKPRKKNRKKDGPTIACRIAFAHVAPWEIGMRARLLDHLPSSQLRCIFGR